MTVHMFCIYLLYISILCGPNLMHFIAIHLLLTYLGPKISRKHTESAASAPSGLNEATTPHHLFQGLSSVRPEGTKRERAENFFINWNFF